MYHSLFSTVEKFLLKQEFYNPNIISLLSYQFYYLKQKGLSELFHTKELQNKGKNALNSCALLKILFPGVY